MRSGTCPARIPSLFVIAEDLISAHGQELWKRVWTVTPLIGNVAEFRRTGGSLNTQEIEDLETLAKYEPRRRLVESRSAFERAGVPIERGLALQRRLGSYGLWRALDLVSGRCPRSEVLDRLLEETGFPDLMQVITEVFRSRADLLRAESVISAIKAEALTSRSLDSASAATVMRRVEQALLSDGAWELRRLHALRLICDDQDPRLRLAEHRRYELRRLFADGDAAGRLDRLAGTSVSDLIRAARKGQERWRAVENSSPIRPTLRDVAELASRAYGQLARELERAMSLT